jgi:hypothetical protein
MVLGERGYYLNPILKKLPTNYPKKNRGEMRENYKDKEGYTKKESSCKGVEGGLFSLFSGNPGFNLLLYLVSHLPKLRQPFSL